MRGHTSVLIATLLLCPFAAAAQQQSPPPSLDPELQTARDEDRIRHLQPEVPGMGRGPTGLDLSLPMEWDPGTAPDPVEPLSITVENAVFLSLRNNQSLSVEQLQPLITGTFEAIERAQFDPTVFAELAVARDRIVRQPEEVEQSPFELRGERDTAELGIRQVLPTGTELQLSLGGVRQESNRAPEQFETRAGITLTQALLRGASIESNLARLRQSQLDTQASMYELRGFAEALVSDVETAYWNYVLAAERMNIFEEALSVAEQQLSDTLRRIDVGQLAETEEAAARAEVALRRQGLIDARSTREQRRLQLLRLMNPPDSDWDRQVETLDEPVMPEMPQDDVRAYLQLAQRLRPDLNEARLRVQRGELEVVRTRNGVLPRLDLFVTLGKSGYADSFGSAGRDIDGPGYDLQAGVRMEAPLGNRGPRAERRHAELSRQQAVESVANLAQLAALDVRVAWLEVDRSRELISATAATRELQEEVLRAEQARFGVGSATALTVAQAQRDLVESQLEEVEATIAYRLALIDLYWQSGTLLLRRGIAAPGNQEVVLR
ncbi:MAG: TolC family protein [Ectothiorhodospiraceae bacterium]|nr:TolC family protein [Ectothiorhodospiraceae bacterium]